MKRSAWSLTLKSGYLRTSRRQLCHEVAEFFAVLSGVGDLPAASIDT